MPFRIALSGLNASQSDLNVTANNVANTATNGFKGSRTEFADLFARIARRTPAGDSHIMLRCHTIWIHSRRLFEMVRTVG
jgi:flagellar hook protein FlgE